MLKGYMGQILDIDLGKRKFEIYAPNEEDLKLYVGGKGIGTRILYDQTAPMIDPLGPENILIFATGPLNGSVVAQSNRFTVTSKSPLSGGIGNSACGGRFANSMKKAGYDIIIVRGMSETPVWIEIVEDKIEFHDASHLWGKGTYETQELLPDKTGKVCIGPAGENLVRYALIASDDRVAGRTGLGAVMGSKKLKAITASGKKKVEIEDQESLKKYNKWLTKYFKNHPQMNDILPRLGTASIVLSAYASNTLPTHNFKYGSFADAFKISGENMAENFLHKNGGCIHCPVRCGREVRLLDQEDDDEEETKQITSEITVVQPSLLKRAWQKLKSWTDKKTLEIQEPKIAEAEQKTVVFEKKPPRERIVKGPEYESVALLGSNLENGSMEHVIRFAYQCDDLGMDSISTGGTLGFTMEMIEKGLLTTQSDVPNIRFGAKTKKEFAAIAKAIEDIAYRRGFGNEMAEGTKRMSEKFGGEDFAMQVKGLDLPGYDPRGNFAQGLEYATTNRGGCHIQGASMYLETIGPFKLNPRSTIGKADLAIMQQNMMACISSMVLCHFTSYAIIPSVVFKLNPHGWPMKILTVATQYIAPSFRLFTRLHLKSIPILWFEKWLTYVTGRKTTLGDVQEIGDRIFNLERIYNIREGFSRKDDTLPRRALEEPIYADTNIGHPLEEMLPKYYSIRGWDEFGIPKPKTLERLKIRR